MELSQGAMDIVRLLMVSIFIERGQRFQREHEKKREKSPETRQHGEDNRISDCAPCSAQLLPRT